MLYTFKRRAHYYLRASEIPKAKDFLEWLSLVRHYEAPSRLLDFSYSFYIATYFAINKTETEAAVYGIDLKWLIAKVDSLVERGEFFQTPEVFYKYAMRHPSASFPDTADRRLFIIPVRPFRSNERIHVQQGLFLCPANINEKFEQNLQAMFINPITDPREHIFKIKIKRKLHPIIMKELQEMNINSETLYPGLGGFAASLKDLFYLPHLIPQDDNRLNDAIKAEPLF